MKKIFYAILLISTFFNVFLTKAQDLTNYNLYVQNPVLYNPAHTVDTSIVKAFINSHLQWVGFDGAPKVHTFGVYANWIKNMGFGLSASNYKQGLTTSTNVNLNYGYRVFFAENNHLSLGMAVGTLMDNFQNANAINVDNSDMTLMQNDFKQTTVSTRVGLSYYYKGFEAQIALPQLMDRGKANGYSLGMMSYDYQIDNAWKVKPEVMFRGLPTSPMQYEANVVGTWQKRFSLQAGFRSNKSILFGMGVNYSNIEIDYAYQLENNVVSAAAHGTHEIQLIYRFGSTRSIKKKIPKYIISGTIKDAYSGKYVKSDVKIMDDSIVTGNAILNDTIGSYSIQANVGKNNILKAKTNGYYEFSENLSTEKSDLTKTIDISMIAENAKITGTVLRKVDNKPSNSTIVVLENNTQVQKTSAINGKFALELKSGKTYQFNATSDNFPMVTKTVEIPAKTLSQEVAIIIEFQSALKGVIKDKETGTAIDATITISQNEQVIQTIPTTNNFSVKLPQGSVYQLSITANDYYTKKLEANLTTADNLELTIEMDKVKKEAFTLGQINFEVAKAILTPESLPILDKFIVLLKDNPTLRFEISGHSDNVGAAEGNRKLSQNRAQACVDYMVSKGIDKNRLKPVGYGQDRPLVPNDSPENKAKNRRVEAMAID